MLDVPKFKTKQGIFSKIIFIALVLSPKSKSLKYKPKCEVQLAFCGNLRKSYFQMRAEGPPALGTIFSITSLVSGSICTNL